MGSLYTACVEVGDGEEVPEGMVEKATVPAPCARLYV